jgi:hypothetical protein
MTGIDWVQVGVAVGVAVLAGLILMLFRAGWKHRRRAAIRVREGWQWIWRRQRPHLEQLVIEKAEETNIHVPVGKSGGVPVRVIYSNGVSLWFDPDAEPGGQAQPEDPPKIVSEWKISELKAFLEDGQQPE